MSLQVCGPADKTPDAGDVLPNGAVVLVANALFILAKNNRAEFVTWRWNSEDLRSTWSGAYFGSDFDAASRNYVARCGAAGVTP